MPEIIYSISGKLPRHDEFDGLTENVQFEKFQVLEASMYDTYLTDISNLLTEVQCKSFNFSNELIEVESMVFTLLENPEESIADFNILYQRVQSYLTRCASILITINSTRSEWQSLKSKADRIYKRVQNYVFTNDATCKTLKNQGLQIAYAEEKMPSLVRLKDIIEQVIPDLKSLEDRVQIRLNDLDRANTNLNRQQKITEDLISLNHQVGTRRTIITNSRV